MFIMYDGAAAVELLAWRLSALRVCVSVCRMPWSQFSIKTFRPIAQCLRTRPCRQHRRRRRRLRRVFAKSALYYILFYAHENTKL